MNVAVKVENVSHLCELQIHLMPIKESEALHRSHTVYEYFRSFFLGNSDAVAQRLEMLCKLPVDEANDVDVLRDLVDDALSLVKRYIGATTRTLAYALLAWGPLRVAHVDSGVRGRREGPGSYLNGEGARVWCGEQGGGRGTV